MTTKTCTHVKVFCDGDIVIKSRLSTLYDGLPPSSATNCMKLINLIRIATGHLTLNNNHSYCCLCQNAMCWKYDGFGVVSNTTLCMVISIVGQIPTRMVQRLTCIK